MGSCLTTHPTRKQTDTITGATISSKVVVSIINNGVADWQTVLQQGIPEEAP